MRRREFIQYTGITLAALTFAGPLFTRRPDEASAAAVQINLSIIGGIDAMIDGTRVLVWAFADEAAAPRPAGARFAFQPGPVIQAFEGDTLRFAVSNTLNEDHGFAIPGLKLKLAEIGQELDTVVIAPGQTVRMEVAAAQAGTYLYLDPLNAPVNRMRGLHGVLVIHPAAGNTP